MSEMNEVSEEDFYARMGPLDVHPSICRGLYPYTSIWKLRDGRIVGKSQDYYPDGRTSGLINTRYFLSA